MNDIYVEGRYFKMYLYFCQYFRSVEIFRVYLCVALPSDIKKPVFKDSCATIWGKKLRVHYTEKLKLMDIITSSVGCQMRCIIMVFFFLDLFKKS